MLNRIAVKISERLLENNIITKDFFDIYVYGLELLVSFFFSTTVIFVIGLVTSRILQTVVFLLTFILIRSFTGGYHAKTYLVCSITTFFCYMMTLLLSECFDVNIYIQSILGLFGSIVIIACAPIENSNKKISHSKRIVFKIISVMIFVVAFSIGVLLNNISNSISDVIFFTLFTDIILLFIKNKDERRKRYEAH